jgi:DNA-binding transcriptional ArsR family regulator
MGGTVTDSCSIMFRALADPTRLRILELLKARERCVSEICDQFELSQPSISHHLDVLKRSDLVRSDKRGREVYYRLNPDAIVECCGRQFRALDIRIERG